MPDLPIEMSQLVDAMLAKEPAARPSLAAVRTVVKRLITTKLPTFTAAGREIASFQGTSKPSINMPPPEISASRVGAEPVVASLDHAQRKSQLRTDKQPLLRTQSAPIDAPVQRARASNAPPVSQAIGSNPDPIRPASEPSVKTLPIDGPPIRKSNPKFIASPSNPGTQSNPGIPSKSTHGRGSGRSTDAPASGLADPAAPPPGTRLGHSPYKANTKQDMEPPVVPQKKSTNHMWLVIGALLAIGAGIVLALVLVGH
jgi:hypothetical protein